VIAMNKKQKTKQFFLQTQIYFFLSIILIFIPYVSHITVVLCRLESYVMLIVK